MANLELGFEVILGIDTVIGATVFFFVLCSLFKLIKTQKHEQNFMIVIIILMQIVTLLKLTCNLVLICLIFSHKLGKDNI